MLKKKNISLSEASSLKTAVLAPMQRVTLIFLRDFISRHGFAPTLKDIAKHLGVRSTSTAHFHLERLIEKGFILRGEHGSFELLEKDALASFSSNEVPLLGIIAAGVPLEAIEASQTIEIPARMAHRSERVFCLEVSGDSMIDAHICDGDVVVVKKQDYADNGQIVVALLEDGSATLKTYRRLKTGHVMLIPANQALQPITLENVTIQGRVIGVIREFM
jgi:repressor LexA